MRRLGYVFDPNDDVDGRVLRSLIPDPSAIPDFIKTAHRLTEEQVEKLSDDHFALVMVDQGQKLKKYACVDKGNTALSVMYLLKQAHLLPSEAVEIAANNLIDACQKYDLVIPMQLKMAAKAGTSPVQGKMENALYRKGAKVNKINFPIPEGPKESTENPALGKGDIEKDVRERTNYGGSPGTNFMTTPVFSQKERQKGVDSSLYMQKNAFDFSHMSNSQLFDELNKNVRNLRPGMSTGQKVGLGLGAAGLTAGAAALGFHAHKRMTEEAVKKGLKEKNAGRFHGGAVRRRIPKNLLGSSPTHVRQEILEGGHKLTKTASEMEMRTRERSFRQLPYVDVSNWNPSEASLEDHVPPNETLLNGKYPVDSYDQVKTATIYFAENWKQFHPRDRHTYCVKLAAKLEQLGIEVPENIARYGSTEYAADVDPMTRTRSMLVDETFRPALDTLLEKRAQVTPDIFAEALAEFDQISGLRWHWDAEVADPWKTTFGISMDKLAQKDWSFSERGLRIGLEELNNLARNGHELLCKSFGDDFATQFAKNPKTFFEALPQPNKLVVARMAMDRHSGTATE
jgi:hypothetical protein